MPTKPTISPSPRGDDSNGLGLLAAAVWGAILLAALITAATCFPSCHR